MKLITHFHSFDSLEAELDIIYHKLKLSTMNIFRLVYDDMKIKGFYNPNNGDKIVDLENSSEFESFQEFLRNLNNVVYFNSIFLGSFSIFEYSLKRVCMFIEKYSDPKVEFELPNRKILKSCRKYIADGKLVDMTNGRIDKIYVNLLLVNEMRNLISHNNGNLIQKKGIPIELQDNYGYCKKHDYLTISSNGQVYINNDKYITDFVSESEEYIKLIINELKNKS